MNGWLRRRRVRRLREHLLRNRSPSSLDLLGANLEGAALDGLKLDGALLGDYKRRQGARLAGASLVGCSLRGARLCYADLSGAKLRWADLTGADLSYAILDNADLRHAILVEADLYQATLTRATLEGANLKHAALFLARFDNTHFARDDLHPPLLYEDEEAYEVFLTRLAQRRGEKRIEPVTHPTRRAFTVYQALKANWRSVGRADEASWAYVAERRLDRFMHAPWRAANNFSEEYNRDKAGHRPFWLARFWLRHTLVWSFSWALDLTSGYGEQPWRAFLVALVVLAIFAFLYLAIDGVVVLERVPSCCDHLIYSLGAFSAYGFDTLQPTSWLSELLTGVEALAGVALFALLMFALGNRISRL